MRPETWASLGAGLLLTAASLAQVLALFEVGAVPKRWGMLAFVARLGGAGALAASVLLATLAHGEWSPSDLRQIILGLGLSTVLIHLFLARRLNPSPAGPVADLVVLALVLVDALAVQPGGGLLGCVQRAVPYQIQWALLLLGSGGAIVAGSAGLMLQAYLWLGGGSRDLDLPAVADMHAVLGQATASTLVILGSGIVVSTWWAWHTVGALANDDPRIGWGAITWLVMAMSELAWRLEPRSPVSLEAAKRGAWAVRLAVAAAATAIFGLLAVGNLTA